MGGTTNLFKPGGTRLITLRWALNGSFVTGVEKDGLRVCPTAGTIVAVVVSQGDRGNNGDNIYDINKHAPPLPITTQRNNTAGVTIFTDQNNRPKIEGLSGSSGDNAVFLAPLPDIVNIAPGEFFSMDVDEKQAQSQDLVIEMFIEPK